MRRERALNFNILHVVPIAVTIFSLVMAVFAFPGALGRVIESGRDFGISIGYYFSETFGNKGSIDVTVTSLPKLPYFEDYTFVDVPTTTLAATFEGFKIDWYNYWDKFANKINFFEYLFFVKNVALIVSNVILYVIPIIMTLVIVLRRFLDKENNDYNKDSVPLKIWKKFSATLYVPLKEYVIELATFIKEHKHYYIAWAIIWAYSFNLITIVLEFFAYYFYFAVSFDIVNLYLQVYKLALDLYIPLNFIPMWIWIILGLIVFDFARKKIAYQVLNHYERCDRGFINDRPIVMMICGTMGKKKTTLLTDMALSEEVILRNEAFEKILENDLKFPDFPWINLELEIKREMKYHHIFNLHTVRKYVRKKKARFFNNPCIEKIFGYDYERYGVTYNNQLNLVDIWDVIETYSQLYFIYVIQSSLLISNYSIRVDNVLSDLGNFPLWNSDFFKKDARLVDSYSRHAHIIDFDTLRLGKKVVGDHSKAFDFGVVLITEVGKERCNSIELSDKKKSAFEANQKNDLFNSWLKMVRHSATVDNYPFVKVITDEQRVESWGADARQLCEIVTITDSGEQKLTMPFFALEELLHNWIFSKFTDIYYDYRYKRGDNMLIMHLLKTFSAKVHGYYTGIYNRFGYAKLKSDIELGTLDGKVKTSNYYLMNKKIYSKRFSTDCFSDFFEAKASRASLGINDFSEYGTERATFDELSQQNSYFVDELLNGLLSDNTS